MGNELSVRKNYWSLDLAKMLCALLIISAHFSSEKWGAGKFPAVIDYGFSIYIIAVPFFFCCSGFLFFKKLFALGTKEEKHAYFVKYQKRIWLMYAGWSLIYLPFQVCIWISHGDVLGEFLKYVHSALVIQTFATIWFLPALAVGIAITYFLITRLSKGQMIALSVALYVIGTLGYTYDFVADAIGLGGVYDVYLVVFKTTRNGLFNAVPFIYMGALVAKKDISVSAKGFLKYGALAAVSFVLMIGESFILKLKFDAWGMDTGIFVAVFTYFFIMMLLHIELKENVLWLWCRKISLGVFVSQRLFLTCLPFVLPSVFEVLYGNGYLGLVLVILLTVGFSVCLDLLSKWIKPLKYLM